MSTKKMFAYYNGTKDAFSKATKAVEGGSETLLSELYNEHIVFITGDASGKDSAIYAHGKYYANMVEVESLASTVSNLKIIKGISVNGGAAKTAADQNGILNFATDENATVTITETPYGIKIGVSEGVVDAVNKKHWHTNGPELDKIAEGDVAKWNEAYAKRHNHDNKPLLDSITDGKVQQWDAAQPNVIETVKVNGTALSVSNKEVNVVIPAASVTGVKAGDKVLNLNGTELETAVSFGKENIDGVEYLVVRGLNNAELGKVPTAEFTADSFLDDVEIKDGKINFVWDMADGSTKTDSVDLSDYILPYSEGDGIDISDKNVVSVEIDAASESFLTVGADGVKLAGVQDAINTAVAGKNVEAEGDDYISASAANNKVSVSASLKTKDAVALAETALQEVTKEDSDYATISVGAKTADHKQSIKVDVKVQAVAAATAANQGLADANDVRLEIAGAKSYADDLFAWEEL